MEPTQNTDYFQWTETGEFCFDECQSMRMAKRIEERFMQYAALAETFDFRTNYVGPHEKVFIPVKGPIQVQTGISSCEACTQIKACPAHVNVTTCSMEGNCRIPVQEIICKDDYDNPNKNEHIEVLMESMTDILWASFYYEHIICKFYDVISGGTIKKGNECTDWATGDPQLIGSCQPANANTLRNIKSVLTLSRAKLGNFVAFGSVELAECLDAALNGVCEDYCKDGPVLENLHKRYMTADMENLGIRPWAILPGRIPFFIVDFDGQDPGNKLIDANGCPLLYVVDKTMLYGFLADIESHTDDKYYEIDPETGQPGCDPRVLLRKTLRFNVDVCDQRCNNGLIVPIDCAGIC